MATLEKIKIDREYSTDSIRVQIKLNEIDGYFWRTSIDVENGATDEECLECANEFVKTITDKEIEEYQLFLEHGEATNWE